MSKEDFDKIAERLGEDGREYIFVKADEEGCMNCSFNAANVTDFLKMLTAIVVAQPKTKEAFKLFAEHIEELLEKKFI